MMMNRALLAVLSLALAAGPGAARPESGAALVVVAQSANPENARKRADRWMREAGVLAGVIRTPPGFPKVVSSAEYPELGKNRNFVVLGMCPLDRAEELAAQLYPFDALAHAKEARAPTAFACPTTVDDWTFVRADPVFVANAAFELQSATYSRKNAATQQPQSMVQLYLRNANGELTDSRQLTYPPGCKIALSSDADVLRVEKSCSAPGEKPKEVLRYTSAKGKIIEAPTTAERTDLVAVVWATAKTEADARAALARWNREKVALGDVVSLPAGFPRIARADEYQGLAPGSHGVILALCPQARLTGTWDALQALDPSAELVKVKASGGEPGCPTVPPNRAVSTYRFATAGEYELHVAVFGSDAGIWEMRIFLRGKDGALVDWKREDGRSVEQHKRGGECLDRPLLESSEGFVEAKFLACYDPGDTEAPDLSKEPWSQELRYSVKDGKIFVRAQVHEPAR